MPKQTAEKWFPSGECPKTEADELTNRYLDTPTLHAAIVNARGQMYVIQESGGSSGVISASDMHNEDPLQYEDLPGWDSPTIDATLGIERRGNLRVVK